MGNSNHNIVSDLLLTRNKMTFSSQRYKFSQIPTEVYTNFQPLSTDVQTHLVSVYAALSVCIATASVGAFVHLQTHIGAGLGTFFLQIGLIGYLAMLPDTQENKFKRQAL